MKAHNMELFSIFFMSYILWGTIWAQETAPLLTLEKNISLDDVRGRIDHMAVDIAGQRLFIAARGNNTVEIVDLKKGKKVKSLHGFSEPQGIAYISEFNKIFITNGGDGTCRILEGDTFKTIDTIRLGEDADNVQYDDQKKQLYIGNGEGALAIINVKTNAKIGDIRLDAHPESFQLEKKGVRIFANVPASEDIAVVDRQKGVVETKWPIQFAKENFPMALDENHHRLFIGCRQPSKILVYDTAAPDNRPITSFAISQDADDLFYDAEKGFLYISCGKGVLEIVQQISADQYKITQTISTAPGARTSLFVPEEKILYVAVPQNESRAAKILVYRRSQ